MATTSSGAAATTPLPRLLRWAAQLKRDDFFPPTCHLMLVYVTEVHQELKVVEEVRSQDGKGHRSYCNRKFHMNSLLWVNTVHIQYGSPSTEEVFQKQSSGMASWAQQKTCGEGCCRSCQSSPGISWSCPHPPGRVDS